MIAVMKTGKIWFVWLRYEKMKNSNLNGFLLIFCKLVFGTLCNLFFLQTNCIVLLFIVFVLKKITNKKQVAKHKKIKEISKAFSSVSSLALIRLDNKCAIIIN